MKRRSAEAVGVILLAAGAMGVFLPRAVAEPVELAPGVRCEKLTCTNDTDDWYRVYWDAVCSNPGTDEPWDVSPTFGWVAPHKQEFMNAGCPYGRIVHHDHDHDHDDDHDDELRQGFLVDGHYKSAVIDNPAPGPTGSAG